MLESLKKGNTLIVKIKAHAPTNAIGTFENGVLQVFIKAPAAEGKANTELLKFLKKKTKKCFKIVSGKKAKRKILIVQ